MSWTLMDAVLDSAISDHTATCVLLVLAQHAHNDGTGARPSRDRIARKARLSLRSVAGGLAWLERSGYIVPTAHDGGGRGHAVEYRICLDLLDLPDNTPQCAHHVHGLDDDTATHRATNSAHAAVNGAHAAPFGSENGAHAARNGAPDALKCAKSAIKGAPRAHQSVRNLPKQIPEQIQSDRSNATKATGAGDRRYGGGGGEETTTTTTYATARAKQHRITASFIPVRDAATLAQCAAAEWTPVLQQYYGDDDHRDLDKLVFARGHVLQAAMTADEKDAEEAEDDRQIAAWHAQMQPRTRAYAATHGQDAAAAFHAREWARFTQQRKRDECALLRIFYEPPATAPPPPSWHHEPDKPPRHTTRTA